MNTLHSLQLYYFSHDLQDEDYLKIRIGTGRSESIHCALDSDHQHGGRRLGNLDVEGIATAAEVRWTWSSELILSDAAKRLVETEKFSGVSFNPVGLASSDLARRYGALWEIKVTGWGGVASGTKKTLDCKSCGHLEYSCDASPIWPQDLRGQALPDFFMIWPFPVYVFVSEAVVKAFKSFTTSGYFFRHYSELHCEDGEDLSPGRLRYYLDDERARSIGEPLGIY